MWGQPFLNQISADTIEPLYLLEQIKIGAFAATTRPLQLSSFNVRPYVPALVRQGSSISYGSLTPGDWTRTYGQATFAVSMDLRGYIERGMAVQLRVGFPGWDVGRFPSVWLGVVRNLRRSRGLWFLDCVEMPGALQNRFSDVSSGQNLFFALPAKTKLGADYNLSPNNLTVLDPTGFQQNDAGKYTLRVTPTGGSTYYVSATGLSGFDFSGTTDGLFDSPLAHGHVGSPIEASTTDTVEAIAWVRAHPLTFAMQILASTGLGTNGSFDTLPNSWGFGIPRAYLDGHDMEAFKRLTLPGGSAYWDFLVDHSQSDGVSWLSEQLRPGGFFVSQHQGCLTARAILQYTVPTPGTVTLTDADLVDVDYQTWADDVPVEYKQDRVLGYNNADPYEFAETDFATRPTRTSRRRDLPQAFSDVSAGWTTEVGDRLGPWDTRVPERLTLTCRGWKAARASLGDFVLVQSDQYERRDQVPIPNVPHKAPNPCLVVGGGPDWFGSTTTLEVIAIAPAAGLE